jgi:hypothetical protein
MVWLSKTLAGASDSVSVRERVRCLRPSGRGSTFDREVE